MQIQLTDIRVQYPGMPRPILQIPGQSIEAGSHLLVRGPSGAGKTTLLHLMAGLLDPTEGRVEIGDSRIHSLSENEKCHWRRREVGLVFQKLNLLGHLTALENVLLGAPGRGMKAETAMGAMKRLGVDSLAEKPAYRLSLGEQQRVAVARVVARNPMFILADEPTSSLDDANAELVINALFEAKGDNGTLVVATHDDRIAGRFSQVWRLKEGRLQ